MTTTGSVAGSAPWIQNATPMTPNSQQPASSTQAWVLSDSARVTIGNDASKYTTDIKAAAGANYSNSQLNQTAINSWSTLTRDSDNLEQNSYGTNAGGFDSNTQRAFGNVNGNLRNYQSEFTTQGIESTASGSYSYAQTLVAATTGASGLVGSAGTPAPTAAGGAGMATAIPGQVPGSAAPDFAPGASASAAMPSGLSQAVQQDYSQEQAATTVGGKSSALQSMLSSALSGFGGFQDSSPSLSSPPASLGTGAPSSLGSPTGGATVSIPNKTISDGLRAIDELRQLVPMVSTSAPAILDNLTNAGKGLSDAAANQSGPQPASTSPGAPAAAFASPTAAPASSGSIPGSEAKSILQNLLLGLNQLTPQLGDTSQTKSVLDDVTNFVSELVQSMQGQASAAPLQQAA